MLHQEPKGNTCRLFFAAGERAIRYFSVMYERERALMKELGAAPEQHLSLVEMRGQQSAAALKHERKLLTEVASLSAPSIAAAAASQQPSDAVFFFHREDAEMPFLSTVSDAIAAAAPTKCAVLACGPIKGEGQFIILPGSRDLQSLGNVVCGALEGKGGLTKFGFRGKGLLKRWKELPKLLQ